MESQESSSAELTPSGLRVDVHPTETLARFVTQSDWVTRSTGRIKSSAFMPDKTSAETSVTRCHAISDERLWESGQVAAGTRTLHGAAIITAQTVSEASVEVEADEPPHFHAVIKKWPSDPDADAQKAARISVAQLLAADATWKPRIP